MPSQHAIEVFAIIVFAGVGLSLLLQPAAWAAFGIWLRREGEAGAVLYGLLCLGFGALIVAFHSVWFGLLIVLTLVGWLQVLKGLLFLLAPAVGMRLIAIGCAQRPGLYRIGGALSLALAAFIFAVLLPGAL